MNSDNNTVISAEMLRKLREAGLADGYTEVPPGTEERAGQLLAGRDIADLDEPTKREFNAKRERHLQQKQRELKGNRRHEEAMRRPFVQDRLTGK